MQGGGGVVEMVMIMVMVTLFTHGKSFCKDYTMLKDQLIIPLTKLTTKSCFTRMPS